MHDLNRHHKTLPESAGVGRGVHKNETNQLADLQITVSKISWIDFLF